MILLLLTSIPKYVPPECTLHTSIQSEHTICLYNLGYDVHGSFVEVRLRLVL